MFETCNEISPNIRLCYRVFKFIRDCFFPLSFGESWCYFLGSYKNCLKVCFSSYSLKKVLFQEVTEFPSSDLWKNDFIHLRIASMLQMFSKYDPDQDIFDNRNEGNRLRHMKNKGVWQSHTSSRNSESIGVYKVARHPPCRRVVACDNYSFQNTIVSFFYNEKYKL